MKCGTAYAMACGAIDCRHCHPENFHNGICVIGDPGDFDVTYCGMYEGIKVTGPNGFSSTFDAEDADDFTDDGIIDSEAFVEAVVLDEYGTFITESR